MISMKLTRSTFLREHPEVHPEIYGYADTRLDPRYRIKAEEHYDVLALIISRYFTQTRSQKINKRMYQWKPV